MRAVLAFPPLVSPTYVPLALATLAPHIRQAAPDCQLQVIDLNIALWDRVAEASPAGLALRCFLHGQATGQDFYDPTAYRAHLPSWRALRAELESVGLAARAQLETGSLPSPLLAALTERVLVSDPELVGLSATFPGQLVFALALARELVARSPRTRVVLGGASLSAVDVDELLHVVPEVEAVLLGEGEPGTGALFGGAALQTVAGLVHRTATGVARNPKTPTAHLAWLPPADYAELDPARYFNPAPVLPVVASRGCPWRRCRFCSHNASFGRFRAKEAALVADQLALLHVRYGARHFYFAEEDLDAPRLGALADALRERELRLSFHAIARPSASFDELGAADGLFHALFQAGGHWIDWGIESGSQRLLDQVLKGTRVETIERVLARAHEAGVSNLLMMIFGLPSSTDEDLAATLAFLERVYPHVDSISGGSFVLFAGTPFARQAERHRLHVLGPQPLLSTPRGTLHSTRLGFKEISDDGSLRPPRGVLELSAWRQRRAWLGEPAFVEELCAEHYLLYASRRAERATSSPLLPAAPRAA